MEFIVDGKRIRYNPYHMKKDAFLGKGLEGCCYKNGDQVLKFYHSCLIPSTGNKTMLDKEMAIHMTSIHTKRFLLPQKVLLNKRRQIKGYITEYIEDLGANSFYQLNSEDLKNELQILDNDLSLLAQEHILLEDIFDSNNSIFHRGIYFIDPGSYSFSKDAGPRNDEVFRFYLENDILAQRAVFFANVRKAQFRCCFHQEVEASGYSSVLSYLQDQMKEENLDQYIKRKIKQYDSLS